MKLVMNRLLVIVVALAFSTVVVEEASSSLTLEGTIPTGGETVVILQAHNQSGATGTLKFKFSAPTPGAYTMGFCIGPATNTCGAASYIVVVPGGEERLAVIPMAALTNSVLAVAQGTNMPLPFAVMME
jgi:hypothetical protein